MPRRPPGALRSSPRRSREPTPHKHIHGLSAKAHGAVRRLEDQHFWPGAVADALEQYENFLRSPGRYLYVHPEWPCCDPVEPRDRLEEALRALPAAARSELRLVVARLDERFRTRTLPDPTAAATSAWWRQRLTGW